MIGLDDVVEALRRSGVNEGDVVFSHANVAMFGKVEGCTTTVDLARLFLRAFTEVLGPEGTLVLPAFTYSFGSDRREKIFRPESDRTNVSALANLLIESGRCFRSIDPMVSVVAVGGAAREITEDVGPASFGSESIWERLHSENALVCNLNLDSGSTFIHWIERLLNVPYRRDLLMSGLIVSGGMARRAECIYAGRDLNDPLAEASFEKLHSLAITRGVTRAFGLGRGQINSYRTRDMFELVNAEISLRPSFLTLGGRNG